jgi:hypothetical protein
MKTEIAEFIKSLEQRRVWKIYGTNPLMVLLCEKQNRQPLFHSV